MLAGIVIGINAMEAGRSIQSGEYLFASIHGFIAAIVYLIERART